MTAAPMVSSALPKELTESDARALTQRVKEQLGRIEDAVNGFRVLLDEVLATKPWIPLGYRDFDAYCKTEFLIGRRQAFRKALTDTVREAVEEALVEALPAGAPPVARLVRETDVRSLRREDAPDVGRRVAARAKEIAEAAPEERAKIVRGSVQEVREERRPQVIDVVARPVEFPPTEADSSADIAAGQGHLVTVDQQALHWFYTALDRIRAFPEPAVLWRSIPDGETWQIAALDDVRRYLDELADLRDMAEA